MSRRMSQDEREEFLAALHVGVLGVAGGGPDGGPLTIPVWYTYRPGGVVTVSTGRDTRKARAVAAAGRFTLCAQDEQPPYKYVTVDGPAVIEDIGRPERLEIAQRYLGIETGSAYVAAGGDGSGSVALRMTPEHWLTADFS